LTEKRKRKFPAAREALNGFGLDRPGSGDGLGSSCDSVGGRAVRARTRQEAETAVGRGRPPYLTAAITGGLGIGAIQPRVARLMRLDCGRFQAGPRLPLPRRQGWQNPGGCDRAAWPARQSCVPLARPGWTTSGTHTAHPFEIGNGPPACSPVARWTPQQRRTTLPRARSAQGNTARFRFS
jgi:hypothetical protein